MENMYLRPFRAFAWAAVVCALPFLLMTGCGKKSPSGRTVCGDGLAPEFSRAAPTIVPSLLKS